APIGYIHSALHVYRHAPGKVELAVVRAGLAPVQEVRAIGRELLDAVVVLVHDVHVIVSVDGDTRGTVECASATAEDTPFAQEGTCGIENRNAVVVLVRDVQALPAVKGHRHGPGELPVTRTKTVAELAQVLFSQRAVRLRSEEHTSELQSRGHLVCRPLLEKKKCSTPGTRRTGSAR